MLGKPAFNDIKDGIVTAPLIFALLDYKNQEEFLAYNNLYDLIQKPEEQ